VEEYYIKKKSRKLKHNLFVIYYILVLSIFIIAVPIFLYHSFKKKYKFSIPARFFLKNNPSFKNHDIWFHACSLGEVSSLEPIVNSLKDRKIDISVTTQTGFKKAKEANWGDVRYLPFEIFLPFWITKHKVLVVTEAELWPMLFYVANLRKIKTILINARISDNSYVGYKKFSWFYKWIFSNIDIVFAQSEIDKERLKELGAKTVHVGGNIKADMKPLITRRYKKPDRRVIVLASSHDGEEELILNSLSIKGDLIIVVPRHPERFDKVGKFLQNFAKKEKLSFGKLTQDEDLEKDIILFDKMGELVNIYNICDIVILCGSFKEGIGGHNPLEPAYFNKKIISGPYIFNQKVLFSLVENIKICKVEELKKLNFDDVKNSKIKQTQQMKELLKEIRIKT